MTSLNGSNLGHLLILLSSFIPTLTSVVEDLPSQSGFRMNSKLVSNIVNGRAVFDRTFYVRIRQIGDIYNCGGVTISPYWVLTAAECVEGSEQIIIDLQLFNH